MAIAIEGAVFCMQGVAEEGSFQSQTAGPGTVGVVSFPHEVGASLASVGRGSGLYSLLFLNSWRAVCGNLGMRPGRAG